MDYHHFLHLVERAAGIRREQAKRATQATLETLAERIPKRVALDLAAKLPPELTAWLAGSTQTEPLDVDEFVRRVARREGVSEESALNHARAVFGAMWQAVGPEELTDVEAELSLEYDRLLPPWPVDEVVQAQAFYKRVARRERLEREEAWRATEAVLETLAERIAKGEVEDLLERLPLELRVPLKRGIEQSGGKATKMSLEDFIDRVAVRAGVDHDLARDYARGVLATLREVVGEKEFVDIGSELPREYLTALAG
jgi:uncharacterized protein (DUF2267 family)